MFSIILLLLIVRRARFTPVEWPVFNVVTYNVAILQLNFIRLGSARHAEGETFKAPHFSSPCLPVYPSSNMSIPLARIHKHYIRLV